MSAYVIGNIVGRLVMSGFIVYVLLVIINRFQFKLAFQRLKRPLPIISIIFVFLFGFAMNVQANDARDERPFYVIELPKAGLSVYVPERPTWEYSLDKRVGTYAVLLNTPEEYYPPASMEIVLNRKLRIDQSELHEVAITAFNTARKSVGISPLNENNLQNVTYGAIEALEDVYEIVSDGRTYSVKNALGIMPSGRPVTLLLTTPLGQIKHIGHMVKKIWDNLDEFPATDIDVNK